MFEAKMTFRTLTLFFAVFLTINVAHAQETALPPVEDSINQLRLTPEQRQRIRTIFENNKTERQTTNRRLREAQIALTQALDAEPTDESIIDQRVNELASAQAAQLRMRLQMRDFMDAQRPIKQRPALRPNQRNTIAPTAPRRKIR